MSANEESMQGTFSEDDYEELWTAITISKERYSLSKSQARLVQEAMARSERGAVVFQTFTIPIPYVTDFFRERRFLKDAKALPERATEEEYKPISPEKLKKLREEVYRKIGKPISKNKEGEDNG